MFAFWTLLFIQFSLYSFTSAAAVDNGLIFNKNSIPYQSTYLKNFNPLDGPSDADSTEKLADEIVNENDNNDDGTTIKAATISPLVLQPNVADAIDVAGGGLLVPLVIPAVATVASVNPQNSSYNDASTSSALITDTGILSGEIKRQVRDLDVAEDIVFRPLFRYRQEQAQRYNSRFYRLQNRRYYQPYIYSYGRRAG